MNIVPPKNFENLKTPTESCNEPIAQEVGTYNISRMIAKKTKFRVCDVEEVVKELGSVLFMLLLERKTVNLDGLYLRNRWNPLNEPKYIRNDEEYWTFGYFNPKVELDLQKRSLFIGKDISYKDEFIEKLLPYAPDGIESIEDLRALSLEIMKETCKDGKDVIVGEDGYIISDSKKKKFFDENFHPTWGEYAKYHSERKKAIKRYWELRRSGEEVDFKEFVTNELEKGGFKIGHEGSDSIGGLQEKTE